MNTKKLVRAALVAAIYTALSYFANIFGITYGPIQCRFSEALTILPFVWPETTWGLFLGCILTNILSPMGIPDLVFGSLATLIAAYLTSKCKNRWIAGIPPVVSNGVIIGAVIAWYEVGFTGAFFGAWLYNCVTVAVGEAIAVFVLGELLLTGVQKLKKD